MKNIREDVINIIASVFDMKAGDVHADQKWEDNNTDSFALVELIVAVQEHFQIVFNSDELGRLQNVNDLITSVEAKLDKKSA